ncbi:hypothetical protein ACIF85_20995 [Streptomyces sp. NPDC086033]
MAVGARRLNALTWATSSAKSKQAHAARVTARPRHGGGLTVSVTVTGA